MGLAIPGNPLSGGKKGGAPPPPDYKGAAEATARGNHANQTSPWANSQWSEGPNGQWSQNMSLDPGLQGAADSMKGQLGSAWANPLDNGQQARQHAEDAIYGRATSRLDPMWNERQRSMGADLINQGVDPNSEAYAKAQGNFGRDRNDAYSSALMNAIMGGGQEAQRQQGMDLQSRMAPMMGMQGLQGLSQMPNAPQGANYLAAAGMQGQYGLDAQQMQNQMWSDLMKGGATAGAAAAASDERLKEDVERHPVEILPGVPLASFRYKWEPEGTRHLGVIAQDLEAKYPHLVTRDRDGYRMVPAALLLK